VDIFKTLNTHYGLTLYRKILVAVDGSDHASHALNSGIETAAKWGAELVILTVVPPLSPLAYSEEMDMEYYTKLEGNLTGYHRKIIDEAAERVLKKLTGLCNVYMEQLRAYGEVSRDPGRRVVSIGYYALIKIDEYDEDLVKKYHARWFPIDNFPRLIFDHNEMVDHALRRLQGKAQNQPIGFELLPQKFTIPQLQKLYEAIFRKEFDKRNFRKKILSFQGLKKLEEKDWESSKKGAYLYQFDQNEYNRLLDSGYNFEVNV